MNMRRARLFKAAGELTFAAIGMLAGCASNYRNYQIPYHSYQVPVDLFARIDAKFAENGLSAASVTRDNVGRVRLAGSYANEDEVERAFLIVQSIVGVKSTSPIYPEDVKVKRWEIEASRAMADFANRTSKEVAAPRKRALVFGINTFLDSRHLPPIQGEDDARLVAEQLRSRGYEVTSLLGPAATKSAMEGAIANLSVELGSSDTLLIYISSHGAQPVPTPSGGDDRRMSIAAYDSGDVGVRKSRDATDFLLNLQATSVRDTLVQDLARQPTRVTRVFIDTCYSGDILRGVPDESRSYILGNNGGEVERASVALSAWSGPSFSSKGIGYVPEPARPGVDRARAVDRRNGYTIITATSESQKSFGPPAELGVFPDPVDSKHSLRGSFFTQSFFAYLARNHGQVDEAFEEARRFTQETVSAGSHGRLQQVPRRFSTIPSAENNLYR